jgi:hypothetical protein
MIWDVRKYTDYRVNPPADEAESRVKSLLYLHVDPAGKAGEGFRFPIFGNRIVTDIWGQDVFEDPDFHHVRYRLEVNAAQIEIRPNTFASKWEDWEEMVIRETLVPIKGPGINVVSTEVKKLLKEKMAKIRNSERASDGPSRPEALEKSGWCCRVCPGQRVS